MPSGRPGPGRFCSRRPPGRLARQRGHGAWWMLVAAALFALMGICVKLGGARFGFAELAFYRSLVALVVMGGICASRRLNPRTPVLRMHLTRSLIGLVALGLYFYSLVALPLATAVTLNYTSHLFLALALVVRDRSAISPRLIVALLLGFSGIVLILNPTLSGPQWFGGVLGLLSGVGAALAYWHVRQLAQAGEPDWRTVLYFSAICTAGTGLWSASAGFQSVQLADVPVLLGLGVSASLAQLALTRAYRTGNALVVGSLAYATIVFASLLAWLFWGDAPGLWALLGMALVIGAGVLSLHASRR